MRATIANVSRKGTTAIGGNQTTSATASAPSEPQSLATMEAALNEHRARTGESGVNLPDTQR